MGAAGCWLPAPHLFGDRPGDFAAEARTLLAKRSAAGTCRDWPGGTEVVKAPQARLNGWR